MNLRVARIGEERALLVSAIRRGDVATLGVGREEEDVAIAARGQHHRVACVRRDFAGNEIAHDDAFRVAIHEHEVEHLGPRKHLKVAQTNLPAHRLIRTEQQLLAGLPSSVKRA